MKMKNELKLWVFCAIIGAVSGLVIWLFLKIMYTATELIWIDYYPWLSFPDNFPDFMYSLPTLGICTIGGLIVGILRKKLGDYPEELSVVLGKIRHDKSYSYKNLLSIFIISLVTLIMGSSVGPEAALVGIIAGLCTWAANNLKVAKNNADEYTQIGMAVSLGVLFTSPLFGIFAVEENTEYDKKPTLPKATKAILYALAIGSALGVYYLLTYFFGGGLEGFPSFTLQELNYKDYALVILYIIAGFLLAKFYELMQKLGWLFKKIPPILRETTGGFILGAVEIFIGASFVTMLFSGEDEIVEFANNYYEYVPIFLILSAFLKVLMTNVCIESGLKGGHFFPLIFAGILLGYGISLMIFPDQINHAVFSAAIVTASLLGGVMKKPLAATILLFLCFPIHIGIWLFLVAAISSKLVDIGKKHEPDLQETAATISE